MKYNPHLESSGPGPHFTSSTTFHPQHMGFTQEKEGPFRSDRFHFWP